MKVLPEFEVLTLAHLLERHAGLQPESIALLAPGEQQISYAQLFAMAGNARHWLACRGLAPGARVAVLMPAGLELAVSCLVIACGAVCVPLHTGLAEPEVLTLLRDARADAVIGLQGDPVPARLARTLGLASLVFDMQQWLHDSPEDATDSSLYWPDPADTALVLMTSGTTGKSKRVPLRQQQLVHSAQQTALHLELRPDDRGLLVMPAYHSQGLVVGLLAPLAAGSTVVCAPVFDASEFLRWVSEFSPTWYTASPLVHQAVIDLVSYRRTGMPAHTFRMIRAASSPLPEILQRRMEDLWRVPVIQAYGITETAGQVTCNPLPPGVQKPGSVGHPVGAELRVTDDEGRSLPAGQTGAVMVRGPSVFGGYEDAPDSNAEAFRDGWFHTGDLGWIDDDGYLFLAGRSREMINRGGEKISPFEVEQALTHLPGVAQAVAYPVTHPTLGENVHAAVVPTPGSAVEGQDLRSALFGVIADFKVPACIHVLDHIPQGAGGKVQRRSLQHQLATLLDAVRIDAPLTSLQSQVAMMFARMLDLPALTFDANFLAIGGDSLSAARLVLEANETWGVELPASALLSRPTVTTFAAALQAAIEEADALGELFQAELDALSDDEAALLLASDSPGGLVGTRTSA